MSQVAQICIESRLAQHFANSVSDFSRSVPSDVLNRGFPNFVGHRRTLICESCFYRNPLVCRINLSAQPVRKDENMKRKIDDT